MILENRIQSIL